MAACLFSRNVNLLPGLVAAGVLAFGAVARFFPLFETAEVEEVVPTAHAAMGAQTPEASAA